MGMLSDDIVITGGKHIFKVSEYSYKHMTQTFQMKTLENFLKKT